MLRKSSLTRAQLLDYIAAAEPKPSKIGAVRAAVAGAGEQVTASELALLQYVARFGDTLRTAIDTLALHGICEFAYELATVFSQFYNECKVVEKDAATGVCTHVRTQSTHAQAAR
jgi:arginyl-tRNA synthetase